MSSPALGPLPATYEATRDALHRLAVYVISPAQRMINGEIILRATPGGFSTFEFAGRVIGVDGGDLVVDGTRRPITTLRAAAAAAGIAPDLAQQEQFDVPPPGDLDEPLPVDPAATHALGAWYAFVTRALDELRAGADPREDATTVRIWPEHFDAAIDLGDETARQRATFGGSPGDRHHPEPYLYASPWAGRIDAFFADPSFRGASLVYPELLSEPDPLSRAVVFLGEARRRILQLA